MDPATLLGGVMVIALTAYALMGGADFGAGIWDLVAHGRTAPAERAAIARAIAPIWEANHVWLILVVTGLFNAFPPAFARISTYLHVPLMLVLIGIILRGASFVFRAYGPADAAFQRRWSHVFAGASLVTPLWLGIVVAAITEGRIDPSATGGFADLYIRPWLSVFAVAVGVFATTLFAFLAAVYLTVVANDDEIVELYRRRALLTGVLVGAMALIVFLLSDAAPHVREALTTSTTALPLHIVTGAAAVATFVLLWTRRYVLARVTAATQVTGILWGWALAQYPYLVRPDLTVSASAAHPSILVLLLWILGAGAVILVPSLVYLYRLFARPEGSSRVH